MGKSFKDYMATLRSIFERFRQYQLKLKPRKWELFRKRVEFLGRWVGPPGLELTDTHIRAITEWPIPTSSKEVEQFLGLVNYHRLFIKNFSEMSLPLYKLTGKCQFRWEAEQEDAFVNLKVVNESTCPFITKFQGRFHSGHRCI